MATTPPETRTVYECWRDIWVEHEVVVEECNVYANEMVILERYETEFELRRQRDKEHAKNVRNADLLHRLTSMSYEEAERVVKAIESKKNNYTLVEHRIKVANIPPRKQKQQQS